MPKKLTYEEVKEYIQENENTLLSEEYVNNRTKLKIKCRNNHEYNMTYHDFKSGCRCPICYKESREVTKTEVEEYLKTFGYSLIGDYHNTQEKIKMKCSEGHTIEMAFCDFKSKGYRCKYCVNKNIKHDKEYIASSLRKYGYTLIEPEYINNTQKLHMICPQGHNIRMSWTLFKMGTRCQKCNCSSGESEISHILDKYNLEYIMQYTFPDCKDQKVLPFDFYVPAKNSCIEFDGEQHYKSYERFGGEDSFKIRQKHDEIKNVYCKEHGISLIRIPYWDFNNIEEIILNKLVN